MTGNWTDFTIDEITPAAQWVDSTVQDVGLDPTSIRSTGAIISLAHRVQSFKENSSVVVDDNGEPLVYHGTNKDFSELNWCSHFGALDTASEFTKNENSKLFPVFLSISRPLRIIDTGVQHTHSDDAICKALDLETLFYFENNAICLAPTPRVQQKGVKRL